MGDRLWGCATFIACFAGIIAGLGFFLSDDPQGKTVGGIAFLVMLAIIGVGFAIRRLNTPPPEAPPPKPPRDRGIM